MRIRYYIRKVAGFLSVGLASVLLSIGIWGVYTASRQEQSVTGFVVMLAMGAICIYGGIRWIRDDGPGLERLPPDLDVSGLGHAATKARQTLSTLIEAVQQDFDSAFIKFPITAEDGITEHLWGYVHSFRDDLFSVSLVNYPFLGHAIDSGRRKVNVSEVEDWMLVEEYGRIRGAFSVIAVFEHFKQNGMWLSPRMRMQRKLLLDAAELQSSKEAQQAGSFNDG